MQKKLLALAVAGALAPAAAMAQSTVEIYGRANLGIDSWKTTGAAAAGANFERRTRIFDSGSRLGFRVNESLGGGMRAFVVMETGANIDTGSQAGQSTAANASTGFLASRDSYVGLGGSWGDVRFGRQSIWWSNGVIAQTGANYINSAVDGLITGHGMVAAPVTRQNSVLSYNTPTFGGFSGSLSYSPHDQEASTFTGAGQEKGNIWGLTGRYTSGALRAQFDWARRNNVTNVDNRDNSGTKVGVGWAYAPGSQISGIIGRLENKNVAAGGFFAAGDDPKVRFWLLNWEHLIGPWQLMAQYYNAREVKGLTSGDSNTDVKGFTIGAKYFLSKRTGIYTSYNTVRNQDRAFADLSGGGYSSAGATGLTAANAGADVKVWAVGLHHNF